MKKRKSKIGYYELWEVDFLGERYIKKVGGGKDIGEGRKRACVLAKKLCNENDEIEKVNHFGEEAWIGKNGNIGILIKRWRRYVVNLSSYKSGKIYTEARDADEASSIAEKVIKSYPKYKGIELQVLNEDEWCIRGIEKIGD